MTEQPSGPLLTPDPREEKLPVWVQEKLSALRIKVRDMEAVVASVRGEHEGSNVRLLGGASLKDTPLPKNSQIAFDSHWGKIAVGHDLEGRLRIQGDNTLILRMNAGNALTAELEN